MTFHHVEIPKYIRNHIYFLELGQKLQFSLEQDYSIFILLSLSRGRKKYKKDILLDLVT